MPIRFACSTCGQRLSVGSQKAGTSAVCPKCKATITIPADSAEPETPQVVPEPPPLGQSVLVVPTSGGYPSSPPSQGGTTNDEPPTFDFGGGIEIVYETPSTSPARAARKRADDEASTDFDRIALPRYVVFVQGILLAVVGIVCFLLGMAVGGAVSESGNRTEVPMPVALSGKVSVAARGNRTPDSGAVLILLPYGAKPDEKGSLVGLRPGDDPAENAPARDFIRRLGGKVAVCDQLGEYTVNLPDRGRYHLLAISGTARPPREQRVDPQEIVQIGKFFDLRSDPLKDRRYQWRTELVRADRAINVDFD